MSAAEGSAAIARTDMALARASSRLAGLFWAAITVSIFSGWFVITRFSVTRELGIWDITALRFGIGAVLLAPVLFGRRATLPSAAWREGLVFAMLWGVPFVLLVAFGLSLTSAAQAATNTPTLMPLFAGVFARRFLGERQGRLRWIGYAAIFAGLLLLLLAGAAAHGPPSLAGLGALTAAAAMRAVYTLLFRRSGLAPIEAAALICVCSAVLFLPIYVLCRLGRLSQASMGQVALQPLYQGLLMSGMAIFTFNRAVSLLGSGAATAIIALLPAQRRFLPLPCSARCRRAPKLLRPQSSSPACSWHHADLICPNRISKETLHDPLLFPSDTEPRKGRALPRRGRFAL